MVPEMLLYCQLSIDVFDFANKSKSNLDDDVVVVIIMSIILFKSI